MPCYRLDNDLWFPPVAEAEEYGLLAVGGDLSSDRLLFAYSLGIFPWYNTGEPILWWSPDPRCVLFPDQVHVSRSLRRFMNKHPYRISFNENFAGVIYWCRRLRAGRDGSGTWITPEMVGAYKKLHQLGFAHSVECWQGDDLIGGIYGVCIGRVFFGESMFSRQVNGSKVALVALLQHLQQQNFVMLDCQQTTEHLLSMGGTEVDRTRFQELLKQGEVPPYGPLTSCF